MKLVVDTSALIEIALDGPEADRCEAALLEADELLISAATVTETLIVAGRRGVEDRMEMLIDGLGFSVVAVSDAAARAAARAYRQWGKSYHPAALNFGDCFAYALAQGEDCALLFVGGDFSRTDVKAARA